MILYSAKLLRDKLFADRPLANQGFQDSVSHAHFSSCSTICVVSCHAQLLGFSLPTWKCFAQVANWVWFIGQCVTGQRCLPIDKHNGCQKNLQKRPPGSGGVHFEIAIDSHVAIDVHAIVWKWFWLKTVPHTPENFRWRKCLMSLIFGVWDEYAKMAKIMHLGNLALYGSF